MPDNPLAPYTDPPIWSKLLTLLVCLGAIEVCSRRQLARRIAYEEATPPTTIVKETPKPKAPQSKLDKWRSTVLCLVAGLMPLSGVLALRNKDWALPRTVIDVFWVSFMMWTLTNNFSSALWTLFPRHPILTKVRGKGSRSDKWDYQIKPTESGGSWTSWSGENLNRVLGFACATACTAATYLGYVQPLSIVCGVQILSMMVGWSAPRIKLKTIVYLEGGVLLLFAVVFGIVRVIELLKGPNKQKPIRDADGVPPGQPSPWVFGLMYTFQTSLMYSLAGIFMKVNMRYEHSRVMPAPTPKAPGVGIPVNHHANVPTLPLHYVAVGSYITCGLVVYSIKAAGGIQEACLDMLLICLSTIVATIMASATWTCFRGDLSSWWNYTEDYISEIDFDTVTELDENGKVVNEKQTERPITP